MGPVRSGPVGSGYLRPDQFLDHLTVIKMNLDRELKKAASAITVISLGVRKLRKLMEYDPHSARTINSAEKSATRCCEVLGICYDVE